jgi:hypothetical protein
MREERTDRDRWEKIDYLSAEIGRMIDTAMWVLEGKDTDGVQDKIIDAFALAKAAAKEMRDAYAKHAGVEGITGRIEDKRDAFLEGVNRSEDDD